MSEESATVPDATKPGCFKRPLFNKPTWSKPQATINTEDLFDRSRITYAHIAAEEEAKRKREAAKKQQQRAHGEETAEPEVKRRRLSVEDESEDESESDDKDVEVTHSEKHEHPRKGEIEDGVKSNRPARPVPSPKSLTKRYEHTVAAVKIDTQRTVSQNIVDLDEEDLEGTGAGSKDGEVTITSVSRPKSPVYDDFPISDEEFPELARKAREKARRKRLEADSIVKPTPDLAASTAHDGSPDLYETPRQPSAPPPEPVVSILITSHIPNTNPLIVNRRLGQRLKDVRAVWCQKQNFTLEAAQKVVLTWRGKRLFDVTSCRSLGIGVDADGNIVMKGEKDVFGEENRQIQMEAMTLETLEEKKKAKERLERNEETQDAPEEPPIDEQKEESQIRIILKAKEREDFKLLVKPTTSIGRMINAFRITNEISPEKEVYLLFDGERLEPPTLVGATELSDMDNIEAYIK
ncbi:hypothetical protein MMC30_004647 [Trapelia coarctata]|nr:hypothetical protein [Trapelia coarctata]